MKADEQHHTQAGVGCTEAYYSSHVCGGDRSGPIRRFTYRNEYLVGSFVRRRLPVPVRTYSGRPEGV